MSGRLSKDKYRTAPFSYCIVSNLFVQSASQSIWKLNVWKVPKLVVDKFDMWLDDCLILLSKIIFNFCKFDMIWKLIFFQPYSGLGAGHIWPSLCKYLYISLGFTFCLFLRIADNYFVCLTDTWVQLLMTWNNCNCLILSFFPPVGRICPPSPPAWIGWRWAHCVANL